MQLLSDQQSQMWCWSYVSQEVEPAAPVKLIAEIFPEILLVSVRDTSG